MAYNQTRFVKDLLEKNATRPPSFSVHLHPEHWTLNNGSKLLYTHTMASLLDDIKAQRIPVDFLDIFDEAKVPFFEGSMIVELQDYRPKNPKDPPVEPPQRSRTVLHPTPETLWADLCIINDKIGKKMTDMDALKVEADILLATSQPLCLDPDLRLTRAVNSVSRVSKSPGPRALKRKADALEEEEKESEKARRLKIMQFFNPRPNRTNAGNFRLLDGIQRARRTVQERTASIPPPAQQAANPSGNMSLQAIAPNSQKLAAVQPQMPLEANKHPKTAPTPQPLQLQQPQPQSQQPVPVQQPAPFPQVRPNGTLTPTPSAVQQQFMANNPGVSISRTSQSPSPSAKSPTQTHQFIKVTPQPATARTPTPHTPQMTNNSAPAPTTQQNVPIARLQPTPQTAAVQQSTNYAQNAAARYIQQQQAQQQQAAQNQTRPQQGQPAPAQPQAQGVANLTPQQRAQMSIISQGNLTPAQQQQLLYQQFQMTQDPRYHQMMQARAAAAQQHQQQQHRVGTPQQAPATSSQIPPVAASRVAAAAQAQAAQAKAQAQASQQQHSGQPRTPMTQNAQAHAHLPYSAAQYAAVRAQMQPTQQQAGGDGQAPQQGQPQQQHAQAAQQHQQHTQAQQAHMYPQIYQQYARQLNMNYQQMQAAQAAGVPGYWLQAMRANMNMQTVNGGQPIQNAAAQAQAQAQAQGQQKAGPQGR